MTAPRPLVVSMGDPAGIGPDLLVAAHHQHLADPAALPRFVVFADPEILMARARLLGLPLALHIVETLAETVPAGHLAVKPVRCAATVNPGKPDSGAAQAIISAIAEGVAAIDAGLARAIVTLPIAKHVLHAAGFTHPGHTEFLGTLAEQHWGKHATPVMMLAGDDLRVVPVTVHVPLAAVPALLTTALIVETGRVVAAALTRDFGIAKPRLAVAGLNPHAGESGSIGHEDIEIIAPAVAELQALGITAFGPASADTLFHAAARARYDACLCMYHDQALIPLKTLAFDRGVNITLGLPFVRTSPDHGTAFDIAGTGKADPTSFYEALKLADRMAERRARVAA